MLLSAACGNDSTSPSSSVSPAANCVNAAATQLAVGAHVVVDPATSEGCLRLPAASASGAEYLVVSLSTTGQVTDMGLTASYELTGQVGEAMASTAPAPLMSRAGTVLSPAARFHAMLRARGRALSRGPRLQASARPAPGLAAATVSVGSQRDFKVCGNANCQSFVTVTATVKHAGPHGLIYLDNAAPANGYTQSDLDRLGTLFDNFMYPIDTTAFGGETDLDGNGAVIILLSPAVNHVSGNCNQTHSVIFGFFFPDDLVSGSPGSNDGEVFYSLVPDPTNTSCTITRAFALQGIGPTFCTNFST